MTLIPESQTTDGNYDTGKGKDRIQAASGELATPLNIFLGPGRDEVVAGTHTMSGEAVGVSVYAGEESARHSDPDVIQTGDGPDSVSAGIQDVLDLGGGNDFMFVSNEGKFSGGSFNGGEGRNTIGLSLWIPFWHPNEHHSWKLDNRAGRITRDGETVALMSGFLDYDVQVRGPLTFLGSELSEVFNSTFLPPEEPLGPWSPRRNWPLRLKMHGGDDVVVYYRGGPDSRFDGGDGTDRFSFAADSDPDKAVLNLSTGTLRHGRTDGPEVRTRAVKFENARWWSGADATIKGTNGPNRIVTRLNIPDREMVVYGKGGPDSIRTGKGDDILIGGRGHDDADAGGGVDRCDTEVRTHCEL